MKKVLFLLLLLGAGKNSYAQKEFNQWSLEVNGGFNKSMGPLTPGYLSPTLNLGHADFGARYMINEYFGFKGNLGFGKFSEVNGKSPEFRTNYLNVTAQGVANFGRMLNFESFARKFSLLGHLGAGGGKMRFEDPALYSYVEPDFYYIITSGISTFYNLGERIALTGDISINVNGRQTYTFDGNAFNAPVQPDPPTNPFIHATGTWWTGSLGLNFYLGKAEQHADWYITSDKYATKVELAEAITGLRDMLKDSDGDGVPDYLDQESNTQPGARVSNNGITLDSDNDGTTDHMDKCPFVPGPSSTYGCPVEEIKDQADYLRKAIEEDYVNVYFGFDSSKPLEYSISAASYVSNFLQKNPGLKLEVKGYADELGGEDYNIKLSEKRAKAVYELLVGAGIEPSRLTFKGYGEDTSLDKSSADVRQMARRASFEIK